MSARSADAREARFFVELRLKQNVYLKFSDSVEGQMSLILALGLSQLDKLIGPTSHVCCGNGRVDRPS